MRPTRYRWFIVFLLFAITTVNYIDRAAISYAIPLIERELRLSPEQAGAVLGAFGLGYAITTLLGGFAVDRYGARAARAGDGDGQRAARGAAVAAGLRGAVRSLARLGAVVVFPVPRQP